MFLCQEKKVGKVSKPLVENLSVNQMSVDTLIAKSPADTIHFRTSMRWELSLFIYWKVRR
jgi:hypothetical protein